MTDPLADLDRALGEIRIALANAREAERRIAEQQMQAISEAIAALNRLTGDDDE